MPRSYFSVVLALAVTPCLAHHSVSAWFDTAEIIELEGTVTAVQWANPHVRFDLRVVADDGSETIWDIESLSLSGISRWGIESDVVRVGDTVRVAGNPSRRSLDNVFVRNILLPSGDEIVLGGETRFDGRERRAGETRQGEEGDGSRPELGLFRVWSTGAGSAFPFPEELDPDFDFSTYSLTERAQAAVAAFDYETDDPTNDCAAKGFPTIMEQPYPMEFVRDGDERIVMRLEEYDTTRIVDMTASLDDVRDRAPVLLGHSVGRWDGDDLIVTTTRSSWGHFDSVGIPLSADAVIVERFSPSADYARLDFSMTVTDPTVFTEPVTVSKHFIYLPDTVVGAFECTVD